jgi:hypothetical protein
MNVLFVVEDRENALSRNYKPCLSAWEASYFDIISRRCLRY